MGVKDAMIELARRLPQDCSWDDVMERIYVCQKIESGIRDAEQGRTLEHEEIFRDFADDADLVDGNRS